MKCTSAAVGHGVRGAANGRQHWPMGPGSGRCGAWRQGPGAVGHGGSAAPI
jgi:hypothetical protein